MEKVWTRHKDGLCELPGSLFGETVKKLRGEGFFTLSNREPVHRLIKVAILLKNSRQKWKFILWSDKMMYTCDLVLFISSFLPLAIIIVFWVCNAMKLIGCTLVNCCCYCWVLSAAEHAYECCLFHCFPAWPTPHRIFLLRSLYTFSSMSWVTGLRRGGGGREGERVNERKGIPLPFSPDPLPLYAGYHLSNAWIRAYILVLFFCSLGSKRIQSSVGNQLHWFFFFKGAKVKPVSNFAPLPCRTQLIELNSTLI